MRFTTRRSLIVLPVVTLFVIGLGTTSSSAAPMPTRDIKQVQAQVEDLQMQAASANEKYNNAQDRLAATRGKLSTIQDKVDREKDALSEAMASVNDLARGVYMSGGVDTTIQVLMADDPADFLAQSAALNQVAASQAADMRRTQTAQLRLAQSEAQLSDQEAIAQQARDEMASAKAEADKPLADAQAVLASLQEAERQRLAQLQAEQRAQSAAAAQAASQAIANSSSGSSSSGGGGGDSSTAGGGGYTGGSRAAIAVQYALSQVGKSYVAAAAGPNSFDCSGLTMAAWRQAGVSLSHYSYSQFSQVRRIPDSELQPGDLVFYFGSGAHHVAMYIGNGKMVSASNPSDGVEIIDYKGPWYGSRYSGAGRVVG